MPLRDFKCPTCGQVRERFYRSGEAITCCGVESEMQELSASWGKTSVFPMESKHITPDGSPLTITDIGHLRRVEREYGVVVTAFSNDPSRGVDHIANPPRYRGEEMRRRRA